MMRTLGRGALYITTIITLGVASATSATAGVGDQSHDSSPDSPDHSATESSVLSTPWTRCASGAEPNYSEVPHMDGGRAKNYPEHDFGWNRLFPGDVLLIDADNLDIVDIDAWWHADGSDLFDPNGISPAQAAPSGWPGPGLNKYGLVGWFTKGSLPASFYGSTAWCVTVPSNVSDAFWTLTINDNSTWDNSGAWDVQIKHYW